MNPQPLKQEYRWSIRKKGKHILNMCARLSFYSGVLLSLMSSMALANPTDGVVAAGAATITSAGNEVQINQTSDRALIEWKSFDIAAGETTRFIQPGANSLALNRVVNSNQISAINGNLLANGRVLVINPNGVIIGPQGNVDTAGFIASTADIGNAAFMNSTDRFDFDRAGNADATVENQGRITVQDAGLALLVAPNVRNSGVIVGNLARLQMGAGDTFGVDFYGDGLLQLSVGASSKLVAENTGALVANGGRVLMSAAAASNVLESVINTTGVIEARSLVNHNGEIVLGGVGANVTVSGKLDASGVQGGNVKVTGNNVLIDSSAALLADADQNGNGGIVDVIADRVAIFRGYISAKGGALFGNGGNVEVSGLGYLSFSGLVDTTAANGETGQLLLDPVDLQIRLGEGDSSNDGDALTTLWMSPGGANGFDDTVSTIYESEIEKQSSNITLRAHRNITVANGGTVTGTYGDGIIELKPGKNLTIETQNDNPSGPTDYAGGINLTGSSFGSNLLFKTTNAGTITITASLGGSSAGDIVLSKLQSETGAINISTDNGAITFNGAVTTAGGSVTASTANSDDIYVKQNITTNGGNLDLLAGNDVHFQNGADINVGGGVVTAVAKDDDVTFDAGSTITSTKTSGTSIILAAGDDFINNAGSGALVTSGTARWLVYSSNPADDTTGGLVNNFKQYNATYGVTAPAQSTGNGFLYKLAPTITAVTTAVSRTYNGTANATLTGATNVVSGAVGGDTVTVSSAGVTGLYNNKNVGTNKTISSLSGSFTMTATNGSVTVYGYSFTAPTTAKGNITAATLTLAAQTDSKTYDGNTDSAATPTIVSGLQTGDSVTGLDQVFDSKNAGSRTLSVSTYTLNDGNSGNNYTVVRNTAAGSIDRAALTIAARADSKTYDGTTSSDETPTVSGKKGSDTVTGLDQVFDSRNAGSRTLLVSAYTVNDGNGGNNYTISTPTASGSISRATLNIYADYDEKTYDGTTASADTPTYTGRKTGDTVTGLDQVFSSRNAGWRTLSVTSYSVNDGNGGNNYNVVLHSALGFIYRAELDLYAVTDTKPYDGTTASDETPTYHGVKTGDSVTGLSQVFSSKNAGNRTLSVNGYTINDGNGGNNYYVDLHHAHGTITRALLTLNATADDKEYDGTRDADVLSYGLSGLVGEETVVASSMSALFDTRHVGEDKTVTIYGITLSNGANGGLASNYTLGETTSTTAEADITHAYLSLEGVYANNKTYDGTTDATLDTEEAGLGGTIFSHSDGEEGSVQDDVSLDDVPDTGFFFDKNAGFYKPVFASGEFTLTGEDAHNYILQQPKSFEADIYRAALTITANDDEKTFDGIPYSGGNGVTYDGFVEGEDESVLGGTIVYGGTSQGAVNTGRYNIRPSLAEGEPEYDGPSDEGGPFDQEGPFEDFESFDFDDDYFPRQEGGAGNYDITYVDGELNITAPPQNPIIFFDELGRPIVSVAAQAIQQDSPFEPFDFSGLDTNVSLGGSPESFAGIEPAAGGDSAEELAGLEPAAGGDGAAGPNGDLSCANAFLENRPCKEE